MTAQTQEQMDLYMRTRYNIPANTIDAPREWKSRIRTGRFETTVQAGRPAQVPAGPEPSVAD
jgi:hypothetical protein